MIHAIYDTLKDLLFAHALIPSQWRLHMLIYSLHSCLTFSKHPRHAVKAWITNMIQGISRYQYSDELAVITILTSSSGVQIIGKTKGIIERLMNMFRFLCVFHFSNYSQLFLIFLSVFQFSNYLALFRGGGADNPGLAHSSRVQIIAKTWWIIGKSEWRMQMLIYSLHSSLIFSLVSHLP